MKKIKIFFLLYIFFNNQALADDVDAFPLDREMKILVEANLGYMSHSNKIEIFEKTLPLIKSKKKLEQFKKYLSDVKYYKEVLDEWQYMQKPFSEKAINGISEKLKCFRVWLTKS